MPSRLRPLVLMSLIPLAGCAGFGNFTGQTANPFARPHNVTNSSENVALAHGRLVPPADLKPLPGQPWPTAYPMDPTIMDIERSGSGVP